MKLSMLAVLVVALTGGAVVSDVDVLPQEIDWYAYLQGSEDQQLKAIEHFRSMGQDGLDDVLDHFKDDLTFEKYHENESLRFAIDQIAQQRDAFASGLYWENDIEIAKEKALATGKPILSLYMLGKLSEEYSCANSRFFRTMLYPDPDVAEYMKENFVLCWSTYMEVPVVTIDFGEGRQIKQTITGNSVHILLDEEGKTMDALPGLNSADQFLDFLVDGIGIFDQIKTLTEEERVGFLNKYHIEQFQHLTKQAESYGTTPGVEIADISTLLQYDAFSAGEFAVGKGIVEYPILREITHVIPKYNMETSRWEDIKKSYGLIKEDFHKNVKSMMMVKRGYDQVLLADREAVNMMGFMKHIVEVEDLKNMYELKYQIHLYMRNALYYRNPATLSTAIYENLFGMRKSDPWMGLYDSKVYSALDHGGFIMGNKE